MTVKTHEERERIHAQINSQIKSLFHMDDISGLLVFSSLNRLTQLSEMCENINGEIQDISVSRWRILLYLFMAEQRGKKDGITPTELSHFKGVTKNTISSLLRGLEEQELVTREMDREDLRVFRIHLTPAGRQMILETAPSRISRLNEMLSGMTPEETQHLISLMDKLSRILIDQIHQCQHEHKN